MKIVFIPGATLNLRNIEPNSILLDCVETGCKSDFAKRRYVFESHDIANVARVSICEQVDRAIRLGLTVDENTTVFCNRLSPEIILSVWLLQNPLHISDEVVVNTIKLVSNAHNFLVAHNLHPLIGEISTTSDDADLDTLTALVAKVDAFINGDWTPSDEAPKMTGIAYSSYKGWHMIDGSITQATVFDAGRLAVIVTVPQSKNGYLVMTKSPYVPLAIGPTYDDDGSYADTLLGRLAFEEVEANSNQDPDTNWGIRNRLGWWGPNGGSKLSLEKILEIAKDFNPL